MRRLAMMVGVISVCASASLAVCPGVSVAGASAQSTYAAAVAFAATQNAHYTSVASQGTSTLNVTGDTSATAGSQTLTVHNGGTVETMTATRVGSSGYVRGNAAALTNILGLTAKESTTYANKWLSFPVTTPAFDGLVSGLRNKDVSTELKMTGPYSFGNPTTIHGRQAQAINGFTTDSTGKKIASTLFVEAGTPPRPLQESTDPGQGGGTAAGSVSFSNWGHKTHVTKPTSAHSLLTLAPAG